MCGIFGLYKKSGGIAAWTDLLDAGVKSLQHRGPDALGKWTDDNAYFGHTRLSIIDLEAGRQPMVTSDGRYVITFNGEIFNYQEVRSRLKEQGHIFETHSDTEVILEAYRAHGPDCAQYFHGMFAFAIYDTVDRVLFAARDRFGIKPFAYFHLGDLFGFSSEPKAFYHAGLLRFSPRTEHFNEFLVFGYMAGPETLHQSISELKAGHWLEMRDGKVRVERYWYPFGGEPRHEASADDVVPELQHKLSDAIHLWMTADVEVAAALSGGLDSSLASAVASQYALSLRTFSAWFPDHADIDERAHVKMMADRLPGRNVLIPISSNALFSNLQRLIDHCDHPIHDPNFYTLMALCDEIREQSEIKVVICGDGADELFGGYERHATVPKVYRESGNPDTLVFARNVVALPRLKRFAKDIGIASRYRWKLAAELRAPDAVNKALELDQLTFLTSYLYRQDVIGMTVGLEFRTTYLEHDLTRFVNSLSGDMKIHAGCHKWILRKAAEKWLPGETAWRVGKVPLTYPVANMLVHGPLREQFDSLFKNDACLAAVYDVAGIRDLVGEHQPEAGRDHSNTLWRLMVLEMWLRSWQARYGSIIPLA